MLVQNEARLKSQQDYGKDLEARKRKLDEELDVLREEMAKVKAQGKCFNAFTNKLSRSHN